MKKILPLFIIMIYAIKGIAQLGPEITSWVQNTTATGYGGILTNVQLVQYNTTDVYVSTTCVPGYPIGPWPGDPNVPSNQNFVFKITRNPAPNTGALTNVPLGHIGVWKNGVSIFNALDAQSYMNLGYWHQNAYVFEGSSFDSCLGHPAPGGEYHHHVSPKCLYDNTDSTHHSPLIGYAFDGYPVYGAFGYADSTGTGTVKRMRSSFQLRSITQRHTLPDATMLAAANWGPDVNASNPIGNYYEDYVYTAGSGDLDVHNGRRCKTPEYPAGTYAYFVTLDSDLLPQFPYTLGSTYYGIVQAGNTGPGSGHNTVPGSTTIYSAGVPVLPNEKFEAMVYPSPANEYVHLFIQPVASNNFTVTICDGQGRTMFAQTDIHPAMMYSFYVGSLATGTYIMHVRNESISYSSKVVIAR